MSTSSKKIGLKIDNMNSLTRRKTILKTIKEKYNTFVIKKNSFLIILVYFLKIP